MNTHQVFRISSLLEGISLLIVFGVSTPLKHFGGVENAAQVTGMIHGILWLGYLLALMNVATERQWPWSKSVLYFFLASLPLGFLWIESKERRAGHATEPRLS